MNGLRSHIKNSKERFIKYPNTSKSVKKLGCASFFQPTSRCLDILMKHSFSCLIHCRRQSHLIVSDIVVYSFVVFYFIDVVCNHER